MRIRTYGVAAGAVLLAACAQIPNGPSVAVMPPPGKPFDLFVADDQLCRNYATQAIGGTSASQAAAATASALIVPRIAPSRTGAPFLPSDGSGRGVSRHTC